MDQFPPDPDEEALLNDLSFAESVLTEIADDLRIIRRNTTFLAAVVLAWMLGLALAFLLSVVAP
jgi:hypothetical protein